MDTEYLKRVGLYILGALLSLGVIFYLGFHLWRTFTREVELEPVLETTVEHTLETEGYYFRNERMLSLSGTGGTLVPSVSDGEKLPIGGEAARLYSGSLGDTTGRISEIDKQIALLTECTRSDNLSLKGAASIDEEIYAILGALRADADDGQALDAVGRRSDFLTAVNKRMILTGMVTDFEREIAALQSERASLVGSLGACLETVTAPESGFYFSACDGFEASFTGDFIRDEKLDFEGLTAKLAEPAGTVGNGGKLATESIWYFVCLLGREQLGLYAEGDTCVVGFGAGDVRRIPMDVYRILEGEDRIALILETRLSPGDFSYTRTQTVHLMAAEYTGFRIPISAVRMVDGNLGVYVLDNSTVRFRRISPLIVENGYYIVETNPDANEQGDGTDSPSDEETEADSKEPRWLSQHESLIIKGRALYDGKVLNG